MVTSPPSHIAFAVELCVNVFRTIHIPNPDVVELQRLQINHDQSNCCLDPLGGLKGHFSSSCSYILSTSLGGIFLTRWNQLPEER